MPSEFLAAFSNCHENSAENSPRTRRWSRPLIHNVTTYLCVKSKTLLWWFQSGKECSAVHVFCRALIAQSKKAKMFEVTWNGKVNFHKLFESNRVRRFTIISLQYENSVYLMNVFLKEASFNNDKASCNNWIRFLLTIFWKQCSELFITILWQVAPGDHSREFV